MADKKVSKKVKASPKKMDKRKITAVTESKQKVQTASKIVKRKSNTGKLSVPAFDINGRSLGKVVLPKEIFGQKPNEKLLLQALRVYRANSFTKTASTKTRAEVRGGGAKPWRQKGTGRARAGSKRSPVWVGGGIVFGPKPINKKLVLPKKMKHQALISALSQKVINDKIKVISNLKKFEPKTKLAASLLKKVQVSKKVLIITDENIPSLKLAIRNIPDTEVEIVTNLNAYEVLTFDNILFAKEAIEKFR